MAIRSEKMPATHADNFLSLDPNTLAQVEITWQMARESFSANDDQILINHKVFQSIGAAGLEELKFRLSIALGDVPVVAYKDNLRGIIRVMKALNTKDETVCTRSVQKRFDTNQNLLGGRAMQGESQPILRAFGKKLKVPRPPNAFILYRQHWHPHYKQHNKDMHNNDISKELGKRWKTEADHVKEKYKKLAQELKTKHAAQYPGYQYTPRKPGEKKRRMTTRKQARLHEAQILHETASFPSPELSSGTDAESPSNVSVRRSTKLHHDQSDNPWSNLDYEQSSAQPIQYQEEDMYTAVLPSAYDNIQSGIRKECGQYGKDYVDVLHDVGTSEIPEEHLLYADPSATLVDYQNEWESLIDWHGLSACINITTEMASDTDDLLAEQASGPDRSFNILDHAEFAQRDYGLSRKRSASSPATILHKLSTDYQPNS